MIRSMVYIHSFSIVHRDIKPQNILINPELHLTALCDFGSAKILVPGEPNISYICSRYYRAPELIFGATKYSTSVDIWSMGCVFVEMMIGHPLFPGETSADQLIEIIKVLGTPKNEQILKMNKDYDDFHLPDIKAVEWSTIIKRPIPPELQDLLTKLFIYVPEDRISAIDALMHPYFDELRKEDFKLPKNESFPDIYNFTPDGMNI